MKEDLIPIGEVDAGAVEIPNEKNNMQSAEVSAHQLESFATVVNNGAKDGLHDAYFAKKVYVKSDDSAGTSTYSFKGNNNTRNSTEKGGVANAIVKNVNEKLKKGKKYVKKESVVSVLTKKKYSKNDSITFTVHKLTPNFEKIEKATLGDEVYVMAKSYNLVGKEVTITIHEKEELLVDKDTALKVTEAKEKDAKELTELKTTFDDNGVAKIKIKLRPKADKDLQKWEKELQRGAEDKTTHSYTAKKEFTVENEAERTSIAATIVENSNKALKDFTVTKEDIANLLEVGKSYSVVDNIPKYKKSTRTDYLWLKVICDGEEEEFLKEDEKWFEVKSAEVIEYYIYSNGTIEKTNVSAPKKVVYYYFDSSNNKHLLGEAKIQKTKRHVRKNVLSKKKNDDVLLAYSKDIQSYSSGDVKFKFLTWNSSSGRWYINIDCFAGLLGAMIEESIEDLGFNGFSIKNGNTAGGSSSHINGEKGDLRYLSTNKNGEAINLFTNHTTKIKNPNFDYDRQKRFNEALYKYGWGRVAKMYSENFYIEEEKEVINPQTKKKEMKKIKTKHLLNHCEHKMKIGKGGFRHYHHIHLTGFDHSIIKEK